MKKLLTVLIAILFSVLTACTNSQTRGGADGGDTVRMENARHLTIVKYKGYTIRQLCQEMHDFYKDRKVFTLQKNLFLHDYLPEYVINPQEAQYEFMRGHGELVDLEQAEGRLALEGALPYPPGVLCIHPGERWSKTAVKYFLDLVEGINQLPGFAPEIQGVYVQEAEDGKKHAYGYVMKKEFDKK